MSDWKPQCLCLLAVSGTTQLSSEESINHNLNYDPGLVNYEVI